MALIIHLIPYDGIGGVERAAQSMGSFSKNGVEFRVEYIYPQGPVASVWSLWNPFQLLQSAASLWRANPDLLIVSLWRSYLIGLVIKLFRPNTPLVVFLHSSSPAHFPDRLLTSVAARVAYCVWGDSRETLSRRLPRLEQRRGRVISFVTDRTAAMPQVAVRPTFAFWGRISVQKGLCRALRMFAEISARWPSARFWIVGPDSGDLGRVKAEVRSLGLCEAVQILGPKDFAGIQRVARDASFYLQTSEMEGMAMSVVEAMQLGLVPVVTAVGEIANYANHGKNAVVVTSDAEAVANVLSLLDDDERYQDMRTQAIATWAHQPIYSDSMYAACVDALQALALGERK